MKIYSMTATFGKLSHETLTFKPGLNIIPAPNEWGKSTWCAFLINMLYGIDTRQRATGNILPDKTRFAPWSGAPMSGRIELCWNGRDITIERTSTARVPFGEFRAFETHTGLDVPELDGTNCGKMLLGVERSVFTRAGFIRHTDMPVSADDALRRRLNDLVTTGDDSGEADRLGSALKDLKNKCRYNSSGLLPQEEAKQAQLQEQLDQIVKLRTRSEELQQQQNVVAENIDLLSNHEATLRYNAAREDALRVERAQEALAQSRQQVSQLQAQLALLPDPAQAQPALDVGNQLNRDYEDLLLEKRMLPAEPIAAPVPAHFMGITPQQALILSQGHYEHNIRLQQQRKSRMTCLIVFAALLGVGALAALAGFLLQQTVVTVAGAGIALIALTVMLVCLLTSGKLRTEQQELQAAHPGLTPEQWIPDAQNYMAQQNAYTAAKTDYDRRTEELSRREALLMRQIQSFVGEGTLQQRLAQWNEALRCKKLLDEAAARMETNETHLQALTAMARVVEPPAFPDQLTIPLDKTQTELANARAELHQIQNQLHQCQGRSEALGQEAVLRSKLDAVQRRINRLEDTYAALEMALEALNHATNTLQQRFSPRISKKAQELFSRLTDNRYNRLTLSKDFSLDVGASDEDTLHGVQWRSDGTADQLYLALRLAVAGELTPDAPLILDDALLRFDDTRLKNAMELLKELADDQQIILFSCHERESDHI